jgi:hypothetical protein
MVALILAYDSVNSDFEYYLQGEGFMHLTSTLVKTPKTFKTNNGANQQLPMPTLCQHSQAHYSWLGLSSLLSTLETI